MQLALLPTAPICVINVKDLRTFQVCTEQNLNFYRFKVQRESSVINFSHFLLPKFANFWHIFIKKAKHIYQTILHHYLITNKHFYQGRVGKYLCIMIWFLTKMFLKVFKNYSHLNSEWPLMEVFQWLQKLVKSIIPQFLCSLVNLSMSMPFFSFHIRKWSSTWLPNEMT